MIKIEKVNTYGWREAIRGMRNPMNSWDRSDTYSCYDKCESGECPNITCSQHYTDICLGENDFKLMKNLCKAGIDHRKFIRMITVYMDTTAPLYWWKEFDTYKVGTVANSCSTMHKIADKEFTVDDFSHEHLMDINNSDILDVPSFKDTYGIRIDSDNLMGLIIKFLNYYRNRFLKTKDKKYWWQMIQLLPSSYNQKRTLMLNYEVLANIYNSRANHKLDEWKAFCNFIETLPYSELITGKFE